MPLNNDFPVPLAIYAKAIAKTHDEVWLKLLAMEHGKERHTEQGWHAFVEQYRDGTPIPVEETPRVDLPIKAAGK